MAISFQYNKTALQNLEKALKQRVRALPTIKNKESALRLEVKKAKDELRELESKMQQRQAAMEKMMPLWVEYNPELLSVKDVLLNEKKIAGVRVPLFEDVLFEQKRFSLFSSPVWLADGLELLKTQARLGLQLATCQQRLELLEYARKKTTQKVNLFEKVQIPGYQEAILKIKRFMEDEENLFKSAQKIVKAKKEKESL
jgi:V/A-type H+-transporting ATPase subunit D